MKLSVIIPCYNEAENISPFYHLCRETFQAMIPEVVIEYIFINDGSHDETFQCIETLIEQYRSDRSEIIGIDFSRNFGKESAMFAGLKESTGDYVTIIDADMQQHPKYVVDMILYLQRHSDMQMVACYQERRDEGYILSLCKDYFYRIINQLSDTHFEKNASDFRVMTRSVADAIIKMKEYNRFSKGIFSWVGFNTHFMPYTVEKRRYGTSSWSFLKLTNFALDGFVSFSTAPLRLASVVGGITSVCAIIYLMVVVFNWMYGTAGDTPGYTTIVSLILLLSGIQLIAIGIIGEYIGKIYLETKKRPLFIVKKKTKTQVDASQVGEEEYFEDNPS